MAEPEIDSRGLHVKVTGENLRANNELSNTEGRSTEKHNRGAFHVVDNSMEVERIEYSTIPARGLVYGIIMSGVFWAIIALALHRW